ncbi:MAG: MATE family efflux transporter [Clostridia bacterium]|nr:MATE family efflux transporter [Clostridia bacterium]
MSKQMTNEEKLIWMTKTPVEKLICRLAVPTIISMLVSSFYNMADTFFLGRSKDNIIATGAVGVVFSLMAVIQAIGFFFGHGCSNYISRKLGSKETDLAEKMASTGFFTAVITGFMLMVPGLFFIEPLAWALGSTELILPKAIEYMRIILIGSPYMVGALVLNNQLRFQGSAFFAMVGITSGAVLNIVLDPIFIFRLDMGVTGAALATVISQFVSFLLLVWGINKSSAIKIRLKNFKPSFYLYKEIIAGGSPSLCRQGIASVAAICLNFAAKPYGEVAIAAMAVVSKIAMFANSVIIGFGQGFQPVCGFNYGAGLYKRVLKAFWFCVRFAFVFLVAVSVLGIIFAPQLVNAFGNGPEVEKIASAALRYQCIVFPLNSFIVLSNMLLQTIRKPVRATALAISRQGLIFIPLIIILPKIFGITGIEICQMVSDIFTFALAVILQTPVLRGLKERNRALAD